MPKKNTYETPTPGKVEEKTYGDGNIIEEENPEYENMDLDSDDWAEINQMESPGYMQGYLGQNTLVQNNQHYLTDYERIINRVITKYCTAQDIFNLQILSNRLMDNQASNLEATGGYISKIGKFCQEMTGIESRVHDYMAVKNDTLGPVRGKKEQSRMVFDDKGYVVLSSNQKKYLLDIRRKLHDTLYKNDDEKDIIQRDYNKLEFEVSGLKPDGFGDKLKQEADYAVDRSKDALKATKTYLAAHPQKKANKASKGVSSGPFSEQKNKLEELKASWKAMESHTPFSFMNSSQFKRMEKDYKAYVKACDNLMAGKSIDGSKSSGNGPSESDLEALKKLQIKMQNSAKEYTSAKQEQKKGGIEAHSSEQGRDRLAMADILSDFNMIPQTAKKAAAKNDGDVRMVTLDEISDVKPSGRAKLDRHREKLQNQSSKSKGDTLSI